jgi:hypothetical protein
METVANQNLRCIFRSRTSKELRKLSEIRFRSRVPEKTSLESDRFHDSLRNSERIQKIGDIASDLARCPNEELTVAAAKHSEPRAPFLFESDQDLPG